jgi:succinoglycan biosynthesis protein ExoW
MTLIAVVVPYYQRTAGILRRALLSILGQQLSPDIAVEIIVADDGSPAPLEPELDGVPIGPPFRLTVVRQANAGAAAARNACLDAIGRDTTYVAFLDSDDLWKPTHLLQAVTALDEGYDYYFCDNERSGAHRSYYAQTGFDRFIRARGTSLGGSYHQMSGAEFFSFSLRSWTSLTPTVVFRRAVAPDLRFDLSLLAAGEDCLFLLRLIGRTTTVCCSTDINVVCGEGVNVFYSKYNWDDPGHLVREVGQLLALYRYSDALPLSRDDRAYLMSCVKRERNDIAFFAARWFLKERLRWPRGLADLKRADARFWRWLPLHAMYVLLLYPLRLYRPKG